MPVKRKTMRSKVWLCDANKLRELGYTEDLILTPKTASERVNGFEPIAITMTFHCKPTKMNLSRLFGKQRKYTYRTVRKK